MGLVPQQTSALPSKMTQQKKVEEHGELQFNMASQKRHGAGIYITSAFFGGQGLQFQVLCLWLPPQTAIQNLAHA